MECPHPSEMICKRKDGCTDCDDVVPKPEAASVELTSLLACPFCGAAAIDSLTGRYARCGNETCFLGDTEFFLEKEVWNTRAAK